MMTATLIFFVFYKPYMPVIFYEKHFFKFSLLKNFCSENWLHLFSSLWINTVVLRSGYRVNDNLVASNVSKENFICSSLKLLADDSQAEKKIIVFKDEQIHRMTIIFTQNFQKLSIWVKIVVILWIGSSSIFSLSLR